MEIKMRWQNLIHKKCPACNARLITMTTGYECPGKRTDECPGHFFVSRVKFIAIMSDSNHAAVRFMNPHERELLRQMHDEIGLKGINIFWRTVGKSGIMETDESHIEN